MAAAATCPLDPAASSDLGLSSTQMPAPSDCNISHKALGRARQLEADSGSCLADEHSSNRLVCNAVPLYSHAQIVKTCHKVLHLMHWWSAMLEGSH